MRIVDKGVVSGLRHSHPLTHSAWIPEDELVSPLSYRAVDPAVPGGINVVQKSFSAALLETILENVPLVNAVNIVRGRGPTCCRYQGGQPVRDMDQGLRG